MVALGTQRLGYALAAALLVGSATSAGAGDDAPPSRLGRLFRLGGNTRSSDASIGKPSSAASKPRTVAPKPSDPAPPSLSSGAGASLSPYGALPATPVAPPTSPTSLTQAPASPPAGGGANRIVAQPRVSRAATESDPLVTRVQMGRSDDGKQFCMFVQIYADGTILDSDGVHHVGADHLRPIAQLLQSGELAKLKGHCGGPASDFIEQVHVVAYDRFHGRLRATSYSHSGNPQGCDPAVKRLNDAIDAITMKLAAPASTSAASSAATPPPTATPVVPVDSDAAPPLNAKPIGLTPDGE